MAGIKDWAEDDRPREKMMAKGASALSNSELLAILINNGTRDKSAVELAKELLLRCGNNIKKLGAMGFEELVALRVKGLGPAKAITIAAAMELGIRRDASENKKDTITCSRDAALFLKANLQHKQHELFVVMFLNQGSKVIAYETVSEGGMTATVIDIRIILKKALNHGATHLIICHNHPSGSLKPSKADLSSTQKIVSAASLLDIKVSDHLIVSNEGYMSFADEGLI